MGSSTRQLLVTCAGWSSRRSAQEHSKGLAQRNVAYVRQGCHNKPFFHAKIFEGIFELDIAYRNDNSAEITAPSKSTLFYPLEVVYISNFLVQQIFQGFLQF